MLTLHRPSPQLLLPTIIASPNDKRHYDLRACIRPGGGIFLDAGSPMSQSISSPQSSTTLSATPSMAAGLETKPRVTPWQDGDAVPADLLESMQARRPNRELIGIDGYLLKSVPLATGWNGLLGRVRKDFTLSLEYRELIMCRVAALNRAEFEWQVHQPAYLEAGGTQEKCVALREEGISFRFNEEERAL